MASWTDEIFKEKNLLQVYLKARVVASTPLNFWLSFLISFVSCAYVLINVHSGWSFFPQSSVRLSLVMVSDLGFDFSTSILGFLIAGFAIFSSIIKLDVFKILAQLPHKDFGISRLKFIFFNFIFVFVHYVSILATCSFLLLLLSDGSIFKSIADRVDLVNKGYLIGIGGILFSLIVGWVAFSILLLKSFIWNLYQSILLAIVADEATRGQ